MPDLPKLFLTLDEAARATGLSRDSIRRAVNAGHLKSKRYSADLAPDSKGKILVRPSELEAWFDRLPDF